ncbi:MAG: N-acetyl-gamma-glutamyl-phosphate reductase, partial [Candidatus Omnitrophica bacterium]|nr:N-acetyl-gamma-glutamyl-phosphate reductase [Candidatus Omnitrophota bacterium]
KHQHQPEMEQELSNLGGGKSSVIFTPHLVPITRGIFATLYFRLKKDMAYNEVRDIYQSFYARAPFVRILPEGEFPKIKDVAYTNYCDINFTVAEKNKVLIVTSAIDNLVKGASGQAVQNMNIMYGWDETAGLA